jgi:hypothetical protein
VLHDTALVGCSGQRSGYGVEVKRVVLVVLGVLCLVGGLALVGAGGVVAVVLGQDGSLSTAPAHVTGTGVALVIEDIAVDASSIPIPSGIGSLTLSARSSSGAPIFLGSAPAATVDTYLTGAPYDVVVDLSAGNRATTRPVPGTQQAPPPSTQAFWSQQATGNPAVLTVRQASASTLVLMNADASQRIDADLIVTFTVTRAWTASWVAIGAGILLLVVGGILFWRASVARSRAAASLAASEAAATGRHSDAAPSAVTVLPGEPGVLPAGELVDGVPSVGPVPGLAALVAEAARAPTDPGPVVEAASPDVLAPRAINPAEPIVELAGQDGEQVGGEPTDAVGDQVGGDPMPVDVAPPTTVGATFEPAVPVNAPVVGAVLADVPATDDVVEMPDGVIPGSG